MRPVRDRQPAPNGERRYGADRRIFLPAAVIAVLYGALWIAALVTGRGGTTLAQALLLVVVIAVPVILIRAWLRYRALELRVTGNGIRYTTGDPDKMPIRTGISIGDTLTAMFATIGTLNAIHASRCSVNSPRPLQHRIRARCCRGCG